MYTKPTAPLSIGGVLDDGFKLTKHVYAQIFLLALIASVIGNIPNMIVGQPALEADPMAVFSGTFLVAWLLSMLIGLLMFGAMVYMIHSAANNTPVSIGDGINYSVSVFVPLVLCSFLYFIVFTIGLFLLVVPGVILGLSLLFGPYLVIIDKLGPVDALKRSHDLVWGNWWRTLAIFTVIGFIFFVIYMVIGVAAGFSAAASGTSDSSGMMMLVQLVIIPLLTAVMIPVIYAMSVAVFNDLKLRKEGGDLQARLDATQA